MLFLDFVKLNSVKSETTFGRAGIWRYNADVRSFRKYPERVYYRLADGKPAQPFQRLDIWKEWDNRSVNNWPQNIGYLDGQNRPHILAPTNNLVGIS